MIILIWFWLLMVCGLSGNRVLLLMLFIVILLFLSGNLLLLIFWDIFNIFVIW